MQLGINIEMLKRKFEEKKKKKKKNIALVKCWQITGVNLPLNTNYTTLHNYHQTYFMLPFL